MDGARRRSIFNIRILSLPQIHGALSYYYENQSDLDAQIRQGWERPTSLQPRFPMRASGGS
jgi:hypothetical protein